MLPGHGVNIQQSAAAASYTAHVAPVAVSFTFMENRTKSFLMARFNVDLIRVPIPSFLFQRELKSKAKALFNFSSFFTQP